jgi:RsiW-degrading membrane proteinase PrsW (M82 family)
VLSLDWFSVGILATGLPIALRDLGPWLGMNGILLLGVLVAPLLLSGRLASASKLAAVVVGPALFLYAKYGGAVAALPAPAATLGGIATLTLPDTTATALLRTVNSLLLGPLLIAGFGVLMNHLLTHPEVRAIPFVRRTLPRRDPDRVVVTSAALGTVFYLTVVLAFTGDLVVVP